MKYIFITIIIIICAASVGRTQEIEVKKETVYSYDVTYTELWLEDSIDGWGIKQNIKLILYLDKEAFSEATRIIVSLDSIKEENNITGRSVQYNFEDRLLGWEEAIDKRLKDASKTEKEKLIAEAIVKDKVKIDSEKYLVVIDFGYITQASKNHKLSLELEYKDGSISPPFILGKKELIKQASKTFPITDQKQ